MFYNYIHCTGLCSFNEMKDIRQSHLLFLGCVSVCLCVCVCHKNYPHVWPWCWVSGRSLPAPCFEPFIDFCAHVWVCMCVLLHGAEEREKHSDTVVHESLFIRATEWTCCFLSPYGHTPAWRCKTVNKKCCRCRMSGWRARFLANYRIRKSSSLGMFFQLVLILMSSFNKSSQNSPLILSQ